MKKLRIAFSKKERGQQLMDRLKELKKAGEVEDEQYGQKKEQYTQLIEEGAQEVETIKASLSAKLEALNRDLEKFPAELKDLELKSKLGEIESDAYVRKEQRLRAKITRLEEDAKETEALLAAKTAEDAGGYIEVQLEKRGLKLLKGIKRPDWL